jgi:ATP-dependent DNA ligase
MLAKLAEAIPAGEGWRYEPKWDGIRVLVFRDGEDVRLISRDDRPLGRYFPELVELVAGAPEPRWVADGEILVVRPDGLAFDLLLQRIHPAASRVRKLAAEWPATLVLFDALARGDRDLRGRSNDERRTELGSLADALGVGTAPDDLAQLRPGPAIVLTPQTDDLRVAERWFADEEGMGQDGVIARRAGERYREGERAMVKVKHRRSVDCVVAGYRLSKGGDGIGSLLLGLYLGEDLHYVGHTSSFRAAERRELLAKLRPLESEPVSEAGDRGGFGEAARSPGGPSRWSRGRESAWVPLRPELVCEVSIDRMQGDRFRHASTFLRWRPERDPRSCTFDQVAGGRSASSF